MGHPWRATWKVERHHQWSIKPLASTTCLGCCQFQVWVKVCSSTGLHPVKAAIPVHLHWREDTILKYASTCQWKHILKGDAIFTSMSLVGMSDTNYPWALVLLHNGLDNIWAARIIHRSPPTVWSTRTWWRTLCWSSAHQLKCRLVFHCCTIFRKETLMIWYENHIQLAKKSIALETARPSFQDSALQVRRHPCYISTLEDLRLAANFRRQMLVI